MRETTMVVGPFIFFVCVSLTFTGRDMEGGGGIMAPTFKTIERYPSNLPCKLLNFPKMKLGSFLHKFWVENNLCLTAWDCRGWSKINILPNIIAIHNGITFSNQILSRGKKLIIYITKEVKAVEAKMLGLFKKTF